MQSFSRTLLLYHGSDVTEPVAAPPTPDVYRHDGMGSRPDSEAQWIGELNSL